MTGLRQPSSALLALLAAACGGRPADEIRVLRGPTMGSSYEVKWYGDVADAAVQSAVAAELDAAERTFSTWREGSEVARFNAHRSQEPFAASDLLRAAVALALELAAASDGAFDPTVMPLSALYRRQQLDPAFHVDAAAQAAARARVGHQQLHVRGETLVKDRPDLELDLDGVVAGLCADRIAARLDALGVRGCMLQITGEVLCRGRKPDGTLWRIGIVDPEQPMPGREGVRVDLPLRDLALCTSGDYRNFIVRDGRVRTHVVDPRTGESPTHDVVSVSVLAHSCALADGLGTALMVVGPAGAARLLARCAEPDAGAWFLLADGAAGLRQHEVRWPEAFALDGRPLHVQEPAAEQTSERLEQLDAAAAAAAAAPDDVAAQVWHGRRLGYLGRYREAVAVFSRALARHEGEPHLLRHRGHRYITLREFAAAERDLQRAAERVRGQPDEVEPDGQPVARRPPHSTLQFNIHYHLGLARFLQGDFAAAETAWRDCLAVVRNDESRVAVSHWLWCALARQGRTADAGAVVAGIGPDLDVVENRAYHQLCRFYAGVETRDRLIVGTGSSGAALAFGLWHHELVAGEAAAGREGLRALAARPEWAAFGVIAAEAELARARP